MTRWLVKSIKDDIITSNSFLKIGNIGKCNYDMTIFFKTHVVNQINNSIL